MGRACWSVAILCALYALLELIWNGFSSELNPLQMTAYCVRAIAIALIPFVIVFSASKLIEEVDKTEESKP